MMLADAVAALCLYHHVHISSGHHVGGHHDQCCCGCSGGNGGKCGCGDEGFHVPIADRCGNCGVCGLNVVGNRRGGVGVGGKGHCGHVSLLGEVVVSLAVAICITSSGTEALNGKGRQNALVMGDFGPCRCWCQVKVSFYSSCITCLHLLGPW